MRRCAVLCSLSIALVLVTLSSWATYTGKADSLLTDEEVAQLSPEALELYKSAVKSFDHIDRDSGVQYLKMAAEAAKDFVPLQFILASRALDRARFSFGVKALEYYDLAEEAIQRVMKRPLLSLEDKRRGEQMLKNIQSERENLPSKEKKKAETGFRAVVLPLAAERAKAMGTEITPDVINKAYQMGEAMGQSTGEVGTTGAATAPATIPSDNIPLPSYGVPTERPAVPQQPQPGGMPYYGPQPAYPPAGGNAPFRGGDISPDMIAI